MFNFFENRQHHFGLDLSDSSLKLAQFSSKSNSHRKVQAYTQLGLPKDVISGSKVNDQKELVRAIKKAITKPDFGKVTTPYVVVSVPEVKSFIRVIQMPVLKREEAEEAVLWEAESYIPLPMDQVYLDWSVLGQRMTAEGERMDVLIMAAPRDYINDLVRILKSSGLVPLALELESEAITRSLIPTIAQESSYLIVDISAYRSNLIIYDQGALRFTSSVPVAGHAFTQAVAKALTIDEQKAEEIKIQAGLDKDEHEGAVRKALTPLINNLTEEIRNTIRFYEEHFGEERRVEQIFLAGGSSKLKELPSFLQNKIDASERRAEHKLRSIPKAKVRLGDPWVNVLKKGQTPPLSRVDSLGIVTALGLALRDFKSEGY